MVDSTESAPSAQAPNKIDDGGPAFPQQPATTADGNTILGHKGMALRDYFAAKAMQSLLIAADLEYAWEKRGEPATLSETAEDAYRYADAMLAARKKGGEA